MISLEEKVGDLLIGGFEELQPDTLCHDLLEQGFLGGIILFRRNLESLEQTQGLISSLRRRSKHPLWVCVDQEGGRVQRLEKPFPQFPSFLDMMQCLSEEQWGEMAQIQAKALRALGFNQNYSPVMDVHSNPNNPVIGDRAFSSDPKVVAHLGSLFIHAFQGAGVAACAKHFPGHGDTKQDSHFELPKLYHGWTRLEEVEIYPFRSAVEANVACIMTAHILFPEIDEKYPATMSSQFIGPILRDRLGYNGVVVSDDLEMKAIADHYDIEEAAVLSITAGCDQLLICHQSTLAERAHRALVLRAHREHSFKLRIEQAYTRVQHLKDSYIRDRSVVFEECVRSYLNWQQDTGIGV